MHSQAPIAAEWQLLAIEQIKRLKAAYFRRLDGKLWDELAQLLTPDCEFITYRDPDNVGPKRRCGRDAIVASVRRTVGEALTLHQGHLLEIDIGARDSATAVWEMQDYAEIPQGAWVRILRGAGRYYEHYRLLGDRWMISRLELKRTSLLIERGKC
jgi:hypothetical protein